VQPKQRLWQAVQSDAFSAWCLVLGAVGHPINQVVNCCCAAAAVGQLSCALQLHPPLHWQPSAAACESSCQHQNQLALHLLQLLQALLALHLRLLLPLLLLTLPLGYHCLTQPCLVPHFLEL
jgi:hypothetical protein